MAKRDKNRSYMDWEYDWMEGAQEEENRREREKERRAQKLQNSKKYDTDDWDDID